jgi:hypothetical protein
MNAKKCVECTEPTKYATGFWDGVDQKTGKQTGGLLYDCNNMNCSLKQEQKAMYEDAEKQRQFSMQENVSNGIDIKQLEEKRKKAEITIMDISRYLEIRPTVYSDYKAERLPMPRELYNKALSFVTKS